MRCLELAKKNFKEIYRNPLWMGLAIGMPVLMLLVITVIAEPEAEPGGAFTVTWLAPGMIVFGFAVLMIVSSGILGGDVQSGLLSRLLTTPLRARDFILACSLPAILLAIIQVILCLGVATLMGMEIHGSLGLAFGILFLAAICFIGIGMALGTSPIGQIVSILLMILLPVFCGCWIDVASTPPFFQAIAYALPFTHAADAARAILAQGAGFGAVATHLYWVIGWTVACFALGTVLFRRVMLR